MKLTKYAGPGQIELFNNPHNGRPFLGLVKIKNGNVNIVSGLTQCRETFNTYYQAALRTGKAGGTKLFFFMHYRCTNKGTSEKFLDGITEAMKIVNLFSRLHNWPLAELHIVRPGNNFNTDAGNKYEYTDDSHFLVVKASSRWAKTPQLLSLFVLLLRCYDIKDLHGAKDYDDFWLRVDNVKYSGTYIRRTDIGHLKNNARLLKQVFSKYNQVFGKLRVIDSWTPKKFTSPEYLYTRLRNKANIYATTYSEGITNLLKGFSFNYKLTLAVMKQARAIGVEFKSQKYKRVKA